jgi:glycosyltransferase involved in cell wall biosynthesis
MNEKTANRGTVKANATDAPLVSVIIPCRNEKDYIATTLLSILNQEIPENGFEVIVADGMSNDGTRVILSRFAQSDSRVRMVDNPGEIVSTGLNEAIRHARGRVIIRMDAHTKYAQNYICQCVDVLNKTGAENVGGPWIAEGDGLLGRAIAAAFQSPFAIGGARSHDPNYTGFVDTVYLGCWPRAVFERYGLFDEELVRNQDDEFNLRVKRAGGKIWQSSCIESWYRPRQTLSDLFAQYSQYGYWKVRIIQKYKISGSIRHLVPGTFVFMLSILPLLSLFSPMMLAVWWLIVGLYFACVFFASVATSARRGRDLFFLLPLVFACYHGAYGCGFLRGVLDFVILRRGATKRFCRLTRPSVGPAES